MKFAAKKDDAVSPVIGTILLVAITVVLVAIIAAVVMPMVGGMNTTHVTGVSVDQNAGTFTLTSGEIPDSIEVTGAASTTDKITSGNAKIGTVVKFKGSSGQSSIVATYKDGSTQVIWTGNVTVH